MILSGVSESAVVEDAGETQETRLPTTAHLLDSGWCLLCSALLRVALCRIRLFYGVVLARLV